MNFLTEANALYAEWHAFVPHKQWKEAMDLLDEKFIQFTFLDAEISSKLHSLVLVLRGNTFFRMSLYSDAIEQYRQANLLFDSEENFLAIGRCFWLMKDFDSAEYYFSQVTDNVSKRVIKLWRRIHE